MDELNLQEIEKKLNTEYQSGQRMVFWYDAESSFEDEVDQLNLPGVQIVHLSEKNAFRVKILIEHEEPDRLKSQMSLRIIWKILCYIQGSSMQINSL